ncbi:MAG: type II toxin-antitoxin system VapC family toxin [Allosphingosinicella sp.]
MAFDFDSLLRKLKPQKSAGVLKRRSDPRLRFVTDDTADSPVLLDTSVYIDQLNDRLPASVRNLLDRSVLNHSAVAITELAHPFGRLDPEHSDTTANLDLIRTVIALIPQNRLLTPTLQASVQAGVVTGIIARRLGLPKSDAQPMLNDATLFFHALETGSVLLTGNVRDLDLIQQLVPAGRGRVLFYRRL